MNDCGKMSLFWRLEQLKKKRKKQTEKDEKMIQPAQAEHLKLTTHKNIVTTAAVQCYKVE